MTSNFYFTATSWFPGNVRIKPHSKLSAGGGLTFFSPLKYVWISEKRKNQSVIFRNLERICMSDPHLKNFARITFCHNFSVRLSFVCLIQTLRKLNYLKFTYFQWLWLASPWKYCKSESQCSLWPGFDIGHWLKISL